MNDMVAGDMPAFPMPRVCPMHPPPEYAQFRSAEPIRKVTLWDGSTAWVITRFRDVRQALGDDRFSAVVYRPDFPKLSPTKDALYAFEPPTFFRMDPPDHGRYRAMLANDFAFHAANGWRTPIQDIVDRLIDGMLEKGPPTDFVKAFASPLPSIVITEMLGIPYEDHSFFETRTQARLDLNTDRETVIRAGREMLEYIDRLLTQREADPTGDDMLSRLVIEQIWPGHLKHADAVAMAELMLRGGHETTASQIAMGLLTLLQHPEQLRLVQDNPALVKTAVEEMLRFNTIVQFVGARVCIEDVEIGGQLIRKGEGIYALISSANRDETRFPNADTFDVTRKINPHLAFGFGTHGCLGQLLARAEMQIAFTELLKRLPGLALAVPIEEISYKSDFFIYGTERLPIAWNS
jgi:cytochrome P450